MCKIRAQRENKGTKLLKDFQCQLLALEAKGETERKIWDNQLGLDLDTECISHKFTRFVHSHIVKIPVVTSRN